MATAITKSKIFEVFESGRERSRKLYTLNLFPGKSVYGESLIKENGAEYRQWDPFKSKLASSILKGCPNIFIRNGDVVLYLGASTGTTVSHVSDIVGEKGFIFAVDIAPRVVRDLVFLCYERKNIAPILADASQTKNLAGRISKVDVLYQDVAQKGQIDIFLKNTAEFLKEGGYAILAVKSRSIDVIKRPRDIFNIVRKEIEKHLTIIDYRELEPFQKDHAVFFCKKSEECISLKKNKHSKGYGDESSIIL